MVGRAKNRRRTMHRVIAFSALIAALLVSPAAGAGLDPTLVVVLGGGLSAGFSGFKLGGDRQVQGWTSLVAPQMGTIIPVPTIREDGLGGVVNAFAPLPGLLPIVRQSGERALPFPFFALNLSVPFLRVNDALRMRPSPRYDGSMLLPAIEGNLLQTYVDVLLGGPVLLPQPPVLKSQVEYAELLTPTMAFVQLGFEDVLGAAMTGNVGLITQAQSFATDYSEILRRMANTNATVIAMTTPDPTQTAYFASIADVSRLYGLSAEELSSRFGLAADDLITLGGLIEIGDTMRGRRTNALSEGSVLPGAAVTQIRAAVTGFNNAIRTAASSNGAKVFDLAGFLNSVRANGASVGSITLGGAYGGGFYSEDGLFPGPTGHALIANAILSFMNSEFGASFRPVDVGAVALNDTLVAERR